MSSISACKSLLVETNATVSGLIATAGNISSSGRITTGNLSTSNVFTLTDGANTGTIDQISTELTLSSSGNRVAIASGNTLEFKNDLTTQLSAYTARELIDDCDVFNLVWNAANPSNLRYALSSTFALNQAVPSTLSVSINTIYAYPVRLIKGQVADGAGFYLSVSGSPQIAYALYSTANPGVRLASTASTTATNNMCLIAFSSAYTVPTTGIYYVCLYCTNVGSSLSMISLAANIYMSYGLSTMTSGLLDKASQTGSVAGGFPATLSGIGMTLSTRVSYALVYSLTA
jgi:hypothetical protein